MARTSSSTRGQITGEPKNDIAKIVSSQLKWQNKKKCVDDMEVEHRIDAYWNLITQKGEIPNVEQLSAYLGEPMEVFKRWSKGDGCSSERMRLIQSALTNFAAIDAQLVAMGVLNTVDYIWRSKQYYGMREPSNRIEIENASPLKDLPSADVIEAKYLVDLDEDDAE